MTASGGDDRRAGHGSPSSRSGYASRSRAPRSSSRRPHPSVFRAGRPRRRLVALLLFAALLIVVVVVRVGFLQTVSAQSLTSYGERQRLSSVKIPAERGTIFD